MVKDIGNMAYRISSSSMVPVLVLGNNSVTVAGPGPFLQCLFVFVSVSQVAKDKGIGRRCPKNCSKERARGAD